MKNKAPNIFFKILKFSEKITEFDIESDLESDLESNLEISKYSKVEVFGYNNFDENKFQIDIDID